MGSLLSLNEPLMAGSCPEQSCPDHQDGQACVAHDQIERGINQQCLWPRELEAIPVPTGSQDPMGTGRGPCVLPVNILIHPTWPQVDSGPDNLNRSQLPQEKALISSWSSLLFGKMKPMRLRHTHTHTGF